MNVTLEIEPLLRQLVAIDSVSSRSNVPLVDLLERTVRTLGFATQRVGYRDRDGAEKVNLVARLGPDPGGERRGLALVGHTDTVPYDSAWREALQLTAQSLPEGLCLVGRGACDTKGFIACALAAASQVEAGRLREPLWLAFTADEEVGCQGAKELVRVRAMSPRHAIVGEPTQLRPIRANKGYCLAEVHLSGVEGHSAYPAGGASAIVAAAALIADIETLAKELAARTDAAFDPPYTTINLGMISGGKAKNIIPGECRFTLEWRPIPSDDPNEVAKRVEALAHRVVEAHPRIGARLEVLRIDAGANTPPTSKLVRFLEAQSGKPAGTVAFGTEAPELAALGAEPVVFGPGDIHVAHQTGELVPTADLTRCTEILAAAIAHFCA